MSDVAEAHAAMAGRPYSRRLSHPLLAWVMFIVLLAMLFVLLPEARQVAQRFFTQVISGALTTSHVVTFVVLFVGFALFVATWQFFRFQYHRSIGVGSLVVVELLPVGLAFEEEQVRVEQRWDAFESIHESERLFILVYPEKSVRIVPKRCLNSDAQLQEMKRALEKYLTRHSHQQHAS